MRRCAIRQRVEEKPESLPRHLVRKTERLEHFRLHVLAMNSNAARAQLVPVQHKVVPLRPTLPGRAFELLDIFFKDSGERMLRAHPRLVRLAPFEKREARYPRKFPFAAVDQVKLVAKIEPH